MKSTVVAAITLLFASLASTAALPNGNVEARAAVPIARVQLNFEDEGAAQADVPLNNSIVTQFATRTASTGSIVEVSGGVPLSKVQCQAYKDKKAKIKVGAPFTGVKDGVFSKNGRDVQVEAVKCKRI